MSFLHIYPPQTLAILLGVVCVLLAHIVRGRRRGKVRILIFGLVVGIVAGVAGIKGTLSFLGLHRITRLSAIVTNAVASVDPERQQIILVGQSYSIYGLDGAEVQKLINKSGYDLQIIQLTVEGVYAIEQDTELQDYLARAPHLPVAIFFEIGIESRTWQIITPYELYRPLSIEASGVSHTWDRIEGSWNLHRPQRDAGATNIAAFTAALGLFLADVRASVGHFLCNVSNCGVLQQLDPSAPGQYSVGYSDRGGHAPNFKASDISQPKPLACTVRQLSAKQSTLLALSLNLRRWQAKEYKALGVPLVAFYRPPSLYESERCFAKAFCANIGSYPCLNGENLPGLKAIGLTG